MGKRWFSPITDRIEYWWQLVWRGWWKPMLILWGLIATYDTMAQQFFPDLPFPSIFELTYSRFPIFGWRLWVVIGLILLLIATLEGAYRKKQAFESQIHELELKLDNIKNARPNIVIRGTTNITTAIRNVLTNEILGKPCFTQALLANDPLNQLQATDAPNVAGHISIYDESVKPIYNDVIGRWSETKEEAVGAQPTEMEQITLPANGRPNPLDIILKYRQDQECYLHTNAGRRRASRDWRDQTLKLSMGNYFVKVRLRSSNVDKNFWLKLTNNGQGTDVQLEVLTNAPLIPDNGDSRI